MARGQGVSSLGQKLEWCERGLFQRFDVLDCRLSPAVRNAARRQAADSGPIRL
jgi:hypothetical protein